MSVRALLRRVPARLRVAFTDLGRVRMTRRRPAIDRLDPMLHRLQRTAAILVLRGYGIAALPARLAELLARYDLRFALATFVRQLGVDLDALATDTHAGHARAHQRFVACLHLIDRIAAEAERSALDPAPLYDRLSGSLEDAEAALQHFRRAAAIDRTIAAASIPFPEFAAFREEAGSLLRTWACLSAAQLEDTFALVSDFRLAGELFDRLARETGELAAWLVARESLLGDAIVLVRRMIDERDRLITQTLAGVRRCDAALKELTGLLDDLKTVAAHVAAPRTSDTEGAASDSEGDRRAKYSARLGVAETETLKEIKTAYRRLAKGCHPDTSGEDGAAKQFHEITEAYQWLIGHVPERRG
jgi:hypothetical protein